MTQTLLRDYYDIPSYNMSFRFQFVQMDSGEVRIYILEQPEYAPGQDTDAHATHRYGLDSAFPYICFEPNPTTLRDAKSVAAQWARRTAYYIRNNNWPNVA